MLTKVTINDLNDVSEGEHIMTDTQHYLVDTTDTEHNMYTGYTCRKGVVVDTPGLNESPVKDLVYMCSLVKALNDPKLPGVSACLLCVKFNSKIDAQYKGTVAYYSGFFRRCSMGTS